MRQQEASLNHPRSEGEYEGRGDDALCAIRPSILAVLETARIAGWSQEEFADALCNLADELIKE
ncbi:hypothetical protein BTE77_05840 [Ensifer adhaerens]|nr:hypothetical protein BTE77_05840 [Ensifer adhaerens]